MGYPNPALAQVLGPARVLAHHAVQVASALGATHIPPDAAHQFANLQWSPILQGFVGRRVSGLQAGLRLEDLTWILGREGSILAELPSEGRTLSDGLTWLTKQVSKHGGPQKRVEPLGYPIPPHPVGEGDPFPPPSPDHAELAAWYDFAHRILDERRRFLLGAADVRVWPHRFDIALVQWIDKPGSVQARSVGLGMAPGGMGMEEPFFYVSPWPYPRRLNPVDLPPGGAWNTAGWTGAYLPGSSVTGERVVVDFLTSASEACRQMLGAS